MLRPTSCPTALRAFSLLELLIVVAILALLIALLLPSLARARESARAAACLANLHHLGAALTLYTLNNNDFAPPREVTSHDNAGTSPWPMPSGYAPNESQIWSDQIVLGQYVNSTNNNNAQPQFKAGAVAPHTPFLCPSDLQHPRSDTAIVNSYGMTSNFLFVQAQWNFSQMWRLSANPTPSREIVALDSLYWLVYPGAWTAPYPFYGTHEPFNGDWNPVGPTSNYQWSRRHNNGTNILFLDGHAQWLPDLAPALANGDITCHIIQN